MAEIKYEINLKARNPLAYLARTLSILNTYE